jgi:hypothetical protein
LETLEEAGLIELPLLDVAKNEAHNNERVSNL